jgi:predicted PhzF superfamily epimerase YddE/YHI9
MTAELYLVDAFTEHAFAGNPAAVVLLDEPRDAAWMQALATELGFSETAFTPRDAESESRWLRWFTPAAEVDLCGHATLATAHILGGEHRFTTRSGELAAVATGDGWVEMDFPADPPAALDVGAELAAAIAPLQATAVVRGVSDVLVEVGSEAEVRQFAPDLDAIAAVDARGVIVTATAERAGIDFVSRCFYPAYGVPEDPVTGSAHTTLASWWAVRLGRDELVGEQVSRRGGVVRVAVRGDRVGLAGRAVTVLRGALLI